jgi:hypothetical protein
MLHTPIVGWQAEHEKRGTALLLVGLVAGSEQNVAAKTCCTCYTKSYMLFCVSDI